MTKNFKEATEEAQGLMRKWKDKTMAKSSKGEIEETKELVREIDNKEEFQELVEIIKNRPIEIKSGTTSDNDAEKCKGNNWLSGYNKEIERIAKEVEKLTKEIADDVALELGEIENEDNIKSPNHYVSESGIEVFDVQEAFIHELKGMAASYWCNVVKYILRFQNKNGVEDLKKAKYYLEKLIDEEE